MTEPTPINLKAFNIASEGEIVANFDSRYFKLDSETRCVTVDINAIRLEVQYPIGTQYIQRPTVKDNDIDVAFPLAQRPETLFGGAWERLFDDEAITFYSGDEAGEQTRIDGLQLDQTLPHKHTSNADGSNLFRVSGGIPPLGTGGSYGQLTVGFAIGGAVTNGVTPYREGTHVKTKNRIELTWIRVS